MYVQAVPLCTFPIPLLNGTEPPTPSLPQTLIVVAFSISQQYILSLQPWYTRSVMDKSNISADTIPATDEVRDRGKNGAGQPRARSPTARFC